MEHFTKWMTAQQEPDLPVSDDEYIELVMEYISTHDCSPSCLVAIIIHMITRSRTYGAR